MAQFNFQYESVLRQRTNVEQIAQREAAVAMREMSELQAQLRRLDDGMKQVNDDVRNNHLTGALDVSFIAAHRRYIVGMERAALGLARQIAEAQAKVNKAQQALIHATRERKSIEKLREKALERWTTTQNRKESEAGDEAGMQIAYENLRLPAE